MPQHPSAPAPSAPPISGQEADRSPDLDRGPEAVRVTAPAIARNGAPEVAPDVTRPDSVGAVAGPVAADEDDPDRPDFDEIDTGAGLELETAPGRLAAGTDVIRRFVKTLPNAPGVYRMIGADGAVLYVGKARKLKARVSNYMRGYGHTARLARMISATVAMEFVTTATETEALLLETNYIKQLKPRFNVLMRDDKSFPFILLTGDHAAPQILKHRGARTRKGDYYGPFASAWAVKRTIDALQKAFLIRTCSDSVYENRTRPCLLHQIKRCAAPCTGEVSIAEYNSLVGDARAFLSGKSRAVKETMAGAMQAAAEALEFEQAARYRDRLAALSAITATQDINPANVEEADVLAVHEEAGVFCIEVFFFRTGQNWGNRAFFPRADRGMEPAEVLEGFLAQFYDERPPPRLILLSHAPEDAELLAEAFSQKAGQRVEILVPKRGEKRDLVEHALTNARDELGRRLAETQSQAKLSALLAEALGLAAPPKRIDVFDNSHIMGTNAVGGMIVHGPNGYAKTHYRTFNIQSTALTPGDDFGMMREVLTRRYSRLLKEHPRGEAPAEIDPEAVPAWPDLILIDGGPGQLGVAREVFDTLGITDVPLVGIAKGLDRDAGRETFHIKGRPPFKLPPRDPALYFVQRLRDEAHRFAIGTHRAKRKKALTKSPLDEIGGIGPARKRALLLHFGTAKAVSRASLQDLQGAPGINAATAKLVYDFFNESAR